MCWVLAVLFSLSVGLQVNDPDAARWMAIYGAAALVCAFLPSYRLASAPGTLVGIVAAAWGAYLGSHVASTIGFSDLFLKMSEKGGAVEVGREAAGLICVALAMLGLSAYRFLRD
jgi:hypothetical protein